MPSSLLLRKALRCRVFLKNLDARSVTELSDSSAARALLEREASSTLRQVCHAPAAHCVGEVSGGLNVADLGAKAVTSQVLQRLLPLAGLVLEDITKATRPLAAITGVDAHTITALRRLHRYFIAERRLRALQA